MKKILLALSFLCSLFVMSAQVIPTPFRGFFFGDTDPVNCTVGVTPLWYNTTTNTLKFCSATDTFTAVTSTANNLSSFAATTSAQLAGVISDETGTGKLTFATSPAFTTDIHCASAGGCTLGTAALPASSAFIGGAATNNFNITGTATAARTVTLPDASITLNGATLTDCGTTSACSATTISTNAKVVMGTTQAMDGASPATVTITSMPAFTGTTSYHCFGTIVGTAATHSITNVTNQSATSTKFYATNGANETVQFVCIGN